LDETPPFKCDEECIDIALEIALLFKMDIIRELHVCRKNYVDGSVPGGFQRTMAFARNGKLQLITGKEIGIENLFLEEDAARRIKTEDRTVFFRVDRLGIPLVEITTSPDLNEPMEARDAAYRIGLLLRSTGKVKKVLGAIRQDINISIAKGNRIEIKGVQKLDWIPELIKYEIQRQLALIEIKDTILKAGITPEMITEDMVDISSILKDTPCKFVNKGIAKGDTIYGMKIPGFHGLFGKEVQPNRRFGTEVAGKVSVMTGLKGLIHSDEDLLGKYQFTAQEIEKVKANLKCTDKDAFVMIIGAKDVVIRAMHVVVDRVKMAFEGVPPETRQAKEDGTHEFLRELHGGSRLYPDTDSLSIEIPSPRITGVQEKLGPYPWDMMESYAKKYKLEKETIENLIMDGNIKLFEQLITIYPDNPMLIVTTLNDSMRVLHREELNIENITDAHFMELFKALKANEIAKEAIDKILRIWAEDPMLSLQKAKDKAGIASVDLSDVEATIKKIVNANIELIKQKGRGATGPLMGDVMKEIGRGAVDGKILSNLLGKAIDAASGKESNSAQKSENKSEKEKEREREKNPEKGEKKSGGKNK
jgi:glutamyl-tRNA(Gln) amidotransferase subunit E